MSDRDEAVVRITRTAAPEITLTGAMSVLDADRAREVFMGAGDVEDFLGSMHEISHALQTSKDVLGVMHTDEEIIELERTVELTARMSTLNAQILALNAEATTVNQSGVIDPDLDRETFGAFRCGLHRDSRRHWRCWRWRSVGRRRL